MDRCLTTYEQALEYLYGRINYERVQTENYTTSDFKLDRMRHLLQRLGNPQERIPAVHVAGTKGKGSTAHLVASILEAAGYRVGLFTSPHLFVFEERLKVNGRQPTRDEIIDTLNQVAREAEPMDQWPGQMAPTFFEITMALAWLWFLREGVEIVVLEVGLGGRLDATNVCRPEVCALTSISRDHVGLLGSSLGQIAAEKAGIVKPGVPVVSGVEGEEARAVIATTCADLAAPLLTLDREIRWESPPGSKTVAVETPARGYPPLPVPFAGRHQARNAALAVAIADSLGQRGWAISTEALRNGLTNARCPLRIEVVQTAPLVVLDVAHNWASVAALLETLKQEFRASRRILIFAASRDKDVPGMLRQLIPSFDSLILTRFVGNPRGTSVRQLARLVHSLSGRPAHQADSPSQAWKLARRLAGPNDFICGTGSFFTAAELREAIFGDEIDPASGPAVPLAVAAEPANLIETAKAAHS